MSLLETAKKYAKGIQIVSDWLGAGGVTVGYKTAQNRADICTGRNSDHRCPFNVVEPSAAKIAGESLKKLVEIKNSAQLRVQGEKSLAMCGVCQCHLATKVWVPIHHVRKHTPDAIANMLPIHCWQRKELETT